MPLITVSERLIQPAGHHRRPRSAGTWIPLEDPDNPDQPPNHYEPGYHFHHNFPAHMPMPDGNGHAWFVFACASNGSTGATYATTAVDAEVGDDASDMTVVGYYAPPGGLGPDGGPGWFLDAFSVARQNFVDDYFVTVEGDSAATEQANVVGELSTVGHSYRLDAYSSIVTTHEPFEQWVGTAATSDDVDVLAADSNGIAIATFRATGTSGVPNVNVHAEEGVKILWGLIAGGDGVVWTSHGPKHVDPGWGTFAERILQAGAVARLSQSMAHASEITRLCVNEVHAAVKQLDAGVAKVGDRVVEP